jgi:tRNA acetyltransferase TAN1
MKARQAHKIEMGSTLEVDDAGIWVTYARGMKGKSMREFKAICNKVWPLSRVIILFIG